MIEEVKATLLEKLGDAEVEIQVNGNSYMLQIVAFAFDGLNALKRQQLVYACINDKIKSGEMHAVTMRLFSPSEWEKQQKYSL